MIRISDRMMRHEEEGGEHLVCFFIFCIFLFLFHFFHFFYLVCETSQSANLKAQLDWRMTGR